MSKPSYEEVVEMLRQDGWKWLIEVAKLKIDRSRLKTKQLEALLGDSGIHPGVTPTDYVRMYPTPLARQKSGNMRGRGSILRGGGVMLGNVLGGKPNPRFVEWLMGYPQDWTMLDWPRSATASSPKSRNGSRGASSKRKPK